MIAAIRRSQEEAFRYAFAVPEERVAWEPMGTGQSVLTMSRELAMTPDWAYWVLTDAKPEDPDSAAEAQRAEMESWATIARCDTVCRAKLERLYELYRAMPDARLSRRSGSRLMAAGTTPTPNCSTILAGTSPTTWGRSPTSRPSTGTR